MASMYLLKNKLVNQDHYLKHVDLIKILFRLRIIDQHAAIDLVMQFIPYSQ